MKKVSCVLLLLLLSVFYAYSAESPDYYESSYMLDNYFVEDGNQGFSKEFLDKTQISILYVESGDILYQWFGHLGIYVETEGNKGILFDYGRFEFGPDFYLNFAMGRLWYRCMGSYAFYELSVAVSDDRSVYIRPLNLTNEEKAAVMTFLNKNSSSEFNTYLYHNYRDNCSTRIRDIFDRLTDGSFKKEMQSRSGYTYRQAANMVLSRNLPVLWTLDALQGRNIDLEQSYWDQMFLPVVFFNSLDEYPDLAGETSVVYQAKDENKRPSYAEEPVNYVAKAASAAVVLGLLQIIFMFLRSDFAFFKVTGAVYSFILHLFFGILGSVLFFMMFFTLHDYTFLNENILFLNPVLLVAAFLSFRPAKHRRSLRFIYSLFVTVILVLIMLKFILPGILIQDNWPQIVFMLIFYLCNLAGLKARTRD